LLLFDRFTYNFVILAQHWLSERFIRVVSE
jgi:hypothetical protein